MDWKSPANLDKTFISDLYEALLDAWNQRDAGAFANLFAPNGNLVGFDGSTVNGQQEIEGHLRPIFADHPTAAYVSIIREVRFLSAETALLRAVVGMVPPGQHDINPATNAVQSLVAVLQANEWRIAMYQNTPAQFHGRPEESAALTAELRALV
ncbi:MAG: SgcJ/EcaC family oxidoreductase [Chloroflexota bacterium]